MQKYTLKKISICLLRNLVQLYRIEEQNSDRILRFHLSMTTHFFSVSKLLQLRLGSFQQLLSSDPVNLSFKEPKGRYQAHINHVQGTFLLAN